jgi:hypothetical protein
MQIKIENTRPSTHSTIKGNFDVLMPEIKLTIKECRLVLNRSGEYFIGFPSHKDTNGSWRQEIYMDDKDNPTYKEILDQAVLAVLEAQRTSA